MNLKGPESLDLVPTLHQWQEQHHKEKSGLAFENERAREDFASFPSATSWNLESLTSVGAKLHLSDYGSGSGCWLLCWIFCLTSQGLERDTSTSPSFPLPVPSIEVPQQQNRFLGTPDHNKTQRAKRAAHAGEGQPKFTLFEWQSFGHEATPSAAPKVPCLRLGA